MKRERKSGPENGPPFVEYRAGLQIAAAAGLMPAPQMCIRDRLTAQIKSHSGGFFPVPAICAGKAFFKNSA